MPKEKKYDVIISESNDSWGCYEPFTLHCNPITKKEIQNYLNKITQHSTIPINSCLYRMNINVKNCGCIDVLLSRSDSGIQSTQKNYASYMKISVQMINGRKCSREACLENIKSGKCTDEFMVNTVGKQFFPDKYAKQK